MGWFYTNGGSLKGLLSELREGYENENGKREHVTGQYRGSLFNGGVFWSVWKWTDKSTGEVKHWITCDLIERSKHDGGAWGYKPLSEAENPYYYNCPLKYLGMAPVECKEWRDKVIQWHKQHPRKKRKVASRF